MSAPKAFVSYSWSSKEHEDWVLRLATELRQSGVDAILDKWDLREGDEANAFMERMVSDPTVEKVLIICDKSYVEKSNTRKGGAGTEAQIISSEIFKSQEQSKFVVLSTELDQNNHPVRPAYYSSRIFIPFIDSNAYSESFDQLLRWIFSQPINKKPEVGVKPRYLEAEKSHVNLPLDAAFNRALDAVRNGRNNAVPLSDEYLDSFANSLEGLRWNSDVNYLGEEVIQQLNDFLPYRNQFISLVSVMSSYWNVDEISECLHQFFEKIIPYFYKPNGMNSWNEMQFDNFKFLGSELFLTAIAVLIKNKKFVEADRLMTAGYYNGDADGYHEKQLVDFTVFFQYVRFLQMRNEHLKLRRLSVHADMIKERSSGSGVSLQDIMQADFVLFLRASSQGGRWYPISNLFAAHSFQDGGKPFEIFVRSTSAKFFKNILLLLGLESKAGFDELLGKFENGELRSPKWDFEQLHLKRLTNFEELCKRH